MERIMKDSGIIWAGKIPSDWPVQKIKYILIDRKENNKPIKTTNILSLTSKQGVIPLSEKDGTGGNKPKEDLSQYRLAYPGDIVLNNMNIISGSVGLSKYFGCVSPVYYMLRPRNSEDDVRYFNYVFQIDVFQRSLIGYGKGILVKETDDGRYNTVRLRLSMDALNNLLFPYPPSCEQRRIADFLDEKCASIDAAITFGEKEIEKLKDYKHAIINKAVTKGLSKYTEMTPSSEILGVDSIPKNWNIKRLKHISTKIYRGNGITKEDVIDDGDTSCVRYGEIYTKYDYSFSDCNTRTNLRKISSPQYFSKGDILFAGTGELIEEIGKNIVYTGEDKCLAGGDIIIAKHTQNPAFLNYALNSDYSQFQKSNDKVKLKVIHISLDDIANLKIILPPLDEQNEIASFLDQKRDSLDRLIRIRQDQVDKLKAYKKTLIYSYVTGKKEVPHG